MNSCNEMKMNMSIFVIFFIFYFCVVDSYWMSIVKINPKKHNQNVDTALLRSISLDGINIDGFDSFDSLNSFSVPQDEEINFRNNAWLKVIETSDMPSAVVSTDLTIPKVNAWQIVDEKVVEQNCEPPGLIQYCSFNSSLHQKHLDKINILFSKVTKYSKNKSSDNSLSVIHEALKISYIGLWEKYAGCDSSELEEAINKAGGIATVLRDLQADPAVILCGILHEVITDYANANKDDISRSFVLNHLKKTFSEDVINLSMNYNKLPKMTLNRTDYSLLQNEYQLQMLVVMADEYRTLYLRLADRVHTMRVLRFLKLSNEEKRKIALEARHVYASLAHKMNLIRFRSELEDISFRFLQPEEYVACKQTHVQAHIMHFNAEQAITNIVLEDEFLSSQGMKCRVVSRVKDKYQLYLKMVRQNTSSPSDVQDCLGLRVIIDCPKFKNESDILYLNRSFDACYHVLNKIRQLPQWQPDENFKDYIRGTKENGYQSLHQNIRERSGVRIEVQIRTRRMHVKAELGEAAHWHYKDTKYKPELANLKLYKIAWRSKQQLRAKTSAEMIGYAKRQIASTRVLVYLEDKSTLLNLEANCTTLDGAFAIHSSLGLAAKKTFVNGKEVHLGYKLQTGDVLTVETNIDKTPCAEVAWLDHVKSFHAIDALRRYLNKNAKGIRVAIGCLVLLCVFSLNYDVIVKRRLPAGKRGFPNADKKRGYPDIAELTSAVKQNCPQFVDISEFLQALGHPNNNRVIVAELMGKLLKIESSVLTVLELDSIHKWAQTQEKNGWSDMSMRDAILLPLLSQILPQCGLKNVTEKWILLVGPRSLTNARSKYYDKLKQRLMIGSKIRHANRTLLSFNPRKESTSINLSYGYTPPPPPLPPSTNHLNQENPANFYSVPHIYKKSPYVLAKKPYSLEASVLLQDRLPLLRLARDNENARAANKLEV